MQYNEMLKQILDSNNNFYIDRFRINCKLMQKKCTCMWGMQT